ncbi:lipopolysaccharide transport periplasmic protein LptA [Thauera linaloolentis]|uniref:Lipopolysaccharide export system protein LptA n=1 Tax=Thauera linaloolentis (strain DSM 12138 / JCM 21573 / CCUG 41526 / CIP 105981 / IAM 15112 / NBRC 102519 / 47Lol) TaxID=1123367 RepID=N6Z453_THAL4|nr:lipopolysaccharide transport periplasmic protein LptA [Thauera linaloolentis]ENO89213.1 lipopolysaccharide transport periplasmic protein LptA [Thauera linaloolentis 47Lol = DSM 12138]MCM8564306.1 lipopolysaccharide transport periplasmic protein LptA [Thauera linaloolentis]
MKALIPTLLLALVAIGQPAFAENADRQQPVNIEADRMTVDDRNKVHVFEGNVILTQGSLLIKGDKLVVTQDAAGFQNGVATANQGKLATFRQKREATNEYVDGEAERIEYDSRNEKARLFNRARVTSGGDEVRGAYIEYDAITENYLATNAPGSKPAGDGRVRAVIQPKNDNKTATPQ